MKSILKNKKGITLVSMVVTIILLLILAGVSIRTLGGENGLITKTKMAKEENRKAEYKEKLTISKTEAIIEKGGQDITLDEYIEQIKADKIEGIKSIEKITNEKASVITKEGYIFIITVNTIEYYENENTLPEMNIKDANIEFTFNANTWTNGNVEVTVSKKEDKYTLQLSKDTEKWTTTNKMIFEENGEIYARLIDELGRTSDIASRKITKIDKEKPVITELTPSTNSVRIKATDDLSGIVGYSVTTTNTEPAKFTECESTKELDVTAENLKQGTTYYVWVKDAAENVSKGKETSTGREKFEIKYDGNGGETLSEKQTKYYDIDITLSTTIPTKVGYHFLGWSTDKTSQTAQYKAGDTFKLNGNITVYAVWEKHNFSNNDGICTICNYDARIEATGQTTMNNNWSFSSMVALSTGWNTDNGLLYVSCVANYVPGVSIGDHSLGGNVGMIIYNNKIDLTNVSKIVMNSTLWSNHSSTTTYASLGISSTNSSSAYNDYYSFDKSTTVSNNGKDQNDYCLTLDVSDYTGSYYIKVTTRHELKDNTAFTSHNYIKNIYLEYK
mgnify:FL=1